MTNIPTDGDMATTTTEDLRVERVQRAGLGVAAVFDDFVAHEVLPPLGITPESFWAATAEILTAFGPRNTALLHVRAELERQLDTWHRDHRGSGEPDEYRAFLSDIGYLEDAPAPFSIDVDGVDEEIASLAGPQLVVPLSNARFALNAANARWGSLYDALYGTDVVADVDGAERPAGFDPERGRRVVAYATYYLDTTVPLVSGSHADVVEYLVEPSSQSDRVELQARTADGQLVGLADATQLVGIAHDGARTTILLVNHGLHIELVVDRDHVIGAQHPAGIADVVLEAAITTIADCEDSVAAVDAADKVGIYRNWLGLMTGQLEATFEKGGASLSRRLDADRHYTAVDGTPRELPGRSLLLIRNVGLHMSSDAVLDSEGAPIPEGLLDAIVTVVIAMYDLRGLGTLRNSRQGSMYVVKPKLHGSAEVAFTVEVFAAIERAFGLPENTVKIGIMDEERRTSVNLAACIAAARRRVIFINTGFLDRTGDEIHTSMEAGPVLPKAEMRSTPWLVEYERHNVEVGLATGFHGVGQIGKGMWAAPDAMAEMVATKGAQLDAGASCAWVPSPTAATLHALHYHAIDVARRQEELASVAPGDPGELLRLPLLDRDLSESEIADELANNAQGILGYVVRWVNQGVGCSKVPDIRGVALMEDRATLRISSQHIANWLRHGVLTEDAVRSAFARMARLVDEQNGGDPEYIPMADDEASPAILASLDLVLHGTDVSNGYTEDVLTRWRLRVKEGVAQLG